MVQSFVVPFLTTDNLQSIITGALSDALLALQSQFSGASAPSNPVAYQMWADTTSGYLKIRNAANSAWITLAPLATPNVFVPESEFLVASMSATTTKKLGATPRAGTATRLVIVCETASSSSSGNEWQPMLRKRTNATPGTPVNLFSGTVGTFTALGGVGGGVEFTAYKVLTYTPNQNQTLAADDLLELVMTKAGTATTLANVMAWVEIQ